MPKVSIILPTFNRADTIMRAVRSVQAQTFQDWELIVVDDGSTDDTATLVDVADARLILIRQNNRGVTEARNAGLLAAKGEYIGFLDSDDEFLSHHVALCVSFLETFPDEQFVSTELLEDFGHGQTVNHYRLETSNWYGRKAALIQSHDLDLPPGETDNYLRVYESRESIGEWGRCIVARLEGGSNAFHYRGMIFERMRYDFLIALTATVMRASTFKTIGLLDSRWATSADFHFLACLCRRFKANFISIPTYIKHEYGCDGALPVLGHIVTGASAMRFAHEWQMAWDDLYWDHGRQEAQLRALRGLRQFWIAEVALKAGQRKAALAHLENARSLLPRLWRAVALYWLVRCMPTGGLAHRVYAGVGKVRAICARLYAATRHAS